MIKDSSDIHYMRQAFALAKKAFNKDEVPIGALVVDEQGKIIGRGYNLSQSKHSQSYHAEVRAIEAAGKMLKDWRLENCTLYVTLEPCLMCMSLIGLSRIKRIVYGAFSPLFGYHLDKEFLPSLYKRQIENVTSGILQVEIEQLLKKFFNRKRISE